MGLVFVIAAFGGILSPSWSAAVWAGVPDNAPPADAALGGDLASAVEAVAMVIVVVLQVLGDQLQAVGAGCDLVRVAGVDRGRAVVLAKREVARSVVDRPVSS